MWRTRRPRTPPARSTPASPTRLPPTPPESGGRWAQVTRRRSEIDRLLQLAKVVKPLLVQALLVFVRVGEIFLGVLDRLAERLGVEVLERNRRLREQNKAFLASVGEAAANED